MNQIYRIVFNRRLGLWQAACEFARGRGKGGTAASPAAARAAAGLRAGPSGRCAKWALASLAAAGPAWLAPAQAAAVLPAGFTPVAGGMVYQQDPPDGASLTQPADAPGIVNWNSFQIGAGGTVGVTQSGASSTLLNRNVGGNPTTIAGDLRANSQLFLFDPLNIHLYSGATVKAAGLVLTSQAISDADFISGVYHLTGGGPVGSVIVDAGATVDGATGSVSLIGTSVKNAGIVTAQRISLVSAGAVDLTPANGLFGVTVAGAAGSSASQISNSGTLKAPGGDVLLEVKSGLTPVGIPVVSNTGMIQASNIRLAASLGGDVLADGIIDAGTGRIALVAAGGSVSQSASGVLTAGTLTGNTYADMTLIGANAVSALDGLTVGGNLKYVSGSSIAQTNALTITGTSSFEAQNNGINLSNPGNRFGQAVSLRGDGITVAATGDLSIASLNNTPPGGLYAASVRLSASGTLALQGVGSLYTGLADISLTSGGPLNLDWSLEGARVSLAAKDDITLNRGVSALRPVSMISSAGGISQTGGPLKLNLLTGSSYGATTLNQAGNQVSTLGDFTANGFSLASQGSLSVSGALQGGSGVGLSVVLGDLTADGAISGDAINLSADNIRLNRSLTGKTISLAAGAGRDIVNLGSISAVTSTTIGSGTLFIGNGGAAGQISGNVVNNAALVFKRSDDVVFGDAISGLGSLTQAGAGTLTLNGVNGMTGLTTVQSGKLLVGGGAGYASASLAGNVRVASGATLGGYGGVGSTQVLAGGVLSPGGASGTLTVNGDLALEQGSTLAIGLGAPSGSPHLAGQGSSVRVVGNLALNGTTLDINAGSDFGVGVYRLFDYGSLTQSHGGLLVANPPAGTTLQIQNLSASRQINLVNSTGLTLKFWNADGQALAGVREGGGTGVWSQTSAVWTDANATVTGAMQPQPGMAVFGGAYGAVTVDGSAGAVVANGLQFTNSRYMDGDTLTLVPAAGQAGPVQVRVGDGSAASSSYMVTIRNDITGSGGLVKTGAGQLALSGTNTYTGGTRIQGGVLSVGSDASLGVGALAIDGGVLQVTGPAFASTTRGISLGDAGGGFDIGTGSLFTVNDSLAGPGGLSKAGLGTLVLAGANGYAGGTTISAGTLTAARSGALGTGAVSVGNAAILQFQGTASAEQLLITNAGIMQFQDNSTAGAATIVTRGGASVTFNDASSGGNARFVADANGYVIFANGSGPARQTTAGSIAGAGRFLLANSVLTVGGNNDSTEVSGVITDLGWGGSLTKTGAGTLTLSGVNAYSGATRVDAGTLRVDGSIAASSGVTVASGASLAGSGTVGATTVQAGGMLAPGNAASTLSVAGDLTLAPGSVYQVQADPQGTRSSLVSVAGRARLQGGSVLHVGPDGNFAPLSTYTIMTAAGGVSGAFDSVSSNYAYLAPKLGYSPNAVTLTLARRDVPSDPGGSGSRPIRFADAAVTGNQRGVADALDTLPQGSALYQRVLSLRQGAPAATFQAMSGELHASAGAALHSAADTVRATPFKYLRASLSAPLQAGMPTAQAGLSDTAPSGAALPASGALPAWAEIIGGKETFDGTGGIARTTVRSGGLFVGADRAVGGGWRVGGALGYTNSNIRTADSNARTDVSGYSAALYGGKAFEAGMGKLNLLVGGAYTWNDIGTRRSIDAAGQNQTLKADYGASTGQLFTELGYAVPVGAGVVLEPYAGLSWTDTRTRGFSETGGDAALSGQSKRDSDTASTLGLRGQTGFTLGRTEGVLRASLGWRHAFGNVAPVSTLAFRDSQSFTAAGTPIARNAALVELGGEVTLSRNAALGVTYNGQFGGGNRADSANLRLSWRY